MFVTILVAVTLGFLVILMMKRVPAPLSQEQRQAGMSDGQAPALSFSIAEFEGLCGRLLQELGLKIERSSTTGQRQLEVLAVNPAPIVGGHYIVHGEILQMGEVVEAVQVLALIDAVKGEGASKGVFFTNGFFADEASKAATGGPIELINGVRFRELLQRYALPATASEKDHSESGRQPLF